MLVPQPPFELKRAEQTHSLWTPDKGKCPLGRGSLPEAPEEPAEVFLKVHATDVGNRIIWEDL